MTRFTDSTSFIVTSPLQILQQYWHYNSFRPQQEEIINSILAAKDTLALLPTGGGKSICYQVPALMKDGLCLVISPLIALMKDQVENLDKRNIPALAVHSGMTFYEVRRTLNNAVHGNFKFLYVSPERLETNLFKEYVHELNINLIAVDEAHCISQWGYDFRPPYLRIANFRDDLPDVPVLALTASATPLVQKDIHEKLKFKDANIFRQSFERPNLSYSVFKVDSKINKALDILNNVRGTSIIYCKSRRLTKQITQLLTLQHISVDFYHAGLTQEERNKKQEAWINNQTRVIVCTNAFGMGIDKPDVRTVIHYDTPDCMESYYQEAGRAGRDSKRSYAVLLYNDEDCAILKALPDIRFPLIGDIRKVYQSLADYLQIPVGIGKDNYYDFDINEFVKKFKLDVHLVINVLKVLEQEDLLTFNENIFLPARVTFTVSKELLTDFEETHLQLKPIIKCLLRTYEGIIDDFVSIHEKQIAKLTRQPSDEVKKQLHQLEALDIVKYLPTKETPQINFLTNRAPAQSLHINHENYLQRRKQYELRTEVMLRYLELQKECRSRHISAYFDDSKVQECGICDVCLRHKNSTLTEEEFRKIEQKIYNNVPDSGIAVKELQNNLNGIKKEKFWKVMEFLQGEKRITVSDLGIVKIT
jgi:ATP-dependent DNA helicase RecQ